jgi:hypothetical protein
MNYPQIKPSLNLDFSNTKTLDPRINFRRGTPGAYYDGKTYAKAEENLISHSEDFSQAGTSFGDWDSRNVNTTTDSTDEFLAPNGEQTAWKLSDSTSNSSNHSLFQLTYVTDSSQEVITSSIFAKAGDSNRYLQLLFGVDDTDYGLPFANFDLFEGTITRNEKTINASMTDAGNGWYRCSITIFTTTISGTSINPVFYMIDDPLANRDQHYVGDGSSGLYIWGAQLEQRDAATAYTPTNGAPVTKYQPQLMFASPDQPRFDHDVLTGESKGLLIEESRTNLIEYSQDFDNVAWTESRSFFSLNKIIAPDGTLTGREFIENTELGGHYVRSTFSVQSGNLTFSVYAKKANGSRYIQLRPYGLGNGIAYANFDVTNGVVVENGTGGSEFVSAKIIDVGNGWYRCIMTANYSTSPTGALFGLSNTAVEIPYITGDNYSGIYIWGAQVEAGSFASSYIKTSGASATRSADDASITGENFSSWYRQDEGSIYSEASTSDFRSSYPRFMINDGTANNRIVTSFFGQQGLRVQSNGNDYINVSNAVSSDNRNYHKRAIALKKDSFSFYTGGESILSDSAGEMPISVNTFAFYNNLAADGADYLNGHIKKLSYYPQRLTNEQLQQLTK